MVKAKGWAGPKQNSVFWTTLFTNSQKLLAAQGLASQHGEGSDWTAATPNEELLTVGGAWGRDGQVFYKDVTEPGQPATLCCI